MSLKIAVLKVLSGHCGGCATVAAINADLEILNTSRDWTDRMRKLAAQAGSIDIFTQGYVLRDTSGWRITGAGQEFLQSIETAPQLGDRKIEFAVPALVASVPEQPSSVTEISDHGPLHHRRDAA